MWADTFPELRTKRLFITLPDSEYAPHVRAFYEENRAHLAPWGPPMPAEMFRDAHWERRLTANREEFERGEKISFSCRWLDAPEQVATVAFYDFVRGPAQRCTLGYTLAEKHQGQGLMSEALAAAIPYVFETTGIHRICASHVEGNLGSGRVLERLGFAIDGHAKGWSYSHDGWADSVLLGLQNPDAPNPW